MGHPSYGCCGEGVSWNGRDHGPTTMTTTNTTFKHNDHNHPDYDHHRQVSDHCTTTISTTFIIVKKSRYFVSN